MEFQSTPVIGFNGSGEVFLNVGSRVQSLSAWQKMESRRLERDSDCLLVHSFVVHSEDNCRLIDDAVDREDLKQSRGLDVVPRHVRQV